jgi:hypothetical protein
MRRRKLLVALAGSPVGVAAAAVMLRPRLEPRPRIAQESFERIKPAMALAEQNTFHASQSFVEKKRRLQRRRPARPPAIAGATCAGMLGGGLGAGEELRASLCGVGSCSWRWRAGRGGRGRYVVATADQAGADAKSKAVRAG